jgi:hypothetical protein
MSQGSYRYTLINRLGILPVVPLGEGEYTTSTQRNAGYHNNYRTSIPETIIFTGEAFARLLKIERSIYRCEDQRLLIERKCIFNMIVTWVTVWEGTFSLNKGDWDLDRCRVGVSLDESESGKCLLDAWNMEIDLFENIPESSRVLTNPYAPDYQFEFKTTTEYAPFPRIGTGYPDAGKWLIYDYRDEAEDDVHTYTIKWVRMVREIPCNDPEPGTEWTLVASNCPAGAKKYVKPASLYDRFYDVIDWVDQENRTVIGSFKIVGSGAELSEIDNGMKLFDVLNVAVHAACPLLTIRSEFFQFNPVTPSAINYVTQAESKVNELVLHQKSDVKRADATNATEAGDASVTTVGKIINNLCAAFNLKWDVVGTDLRIEHVSYYDAIQGLDLTIPRYGHHVVGMRKYTYPEDKLIREDRFHAMEAGNKDFVGRPIQYNECIPGSSRGEVRDTALDSWTTDVELVANNPSPDSGVVSDNGFVLIATRITAGVRYMITEGAILEPTQRLNNSLAWAQLHRDYYRHNRPVGSGLMNGVQTTFLSTERTRQGYPITIPFCCDDSFNPHDLVKTPLGLGEVETAVYSFKDQTLTLTLLYSAEEGLQQNTNPVAVNDSYTIPQDTITVFDILANDTETDQGGTFTNIQIVTAPVHGTLVVMPDLRVQYTPTLGYVGTDGFVYRVLDDWQAASNEALVSITVFAVDGPPIAVNDAYEMFTGETLFVPTPGVFANDSSYSGIFLDTYDATSANGGTVAIGPTGALTYTPPSAFTGTDTFTYTIENAEGETDTATVTITVKALTGVIIRPDEYQATGNDTLVVSAGDGVLANDSTGSGTLTVTAGTIATSAGGVVSMNANGSFTYNRPPGQYSGTDTFTYTAGNGTSSGSALVTVIVPLRVFARIIVPDTEETRSATYQNCSGVEKIKRTTWKRNVYVQFYSDSAGTTPVDVSVYNIEVNYLIHAAIYGPGPAIPDVTKMKVANPTPGGKFMLENQHDFKTTDAGCTGGRLYDVWYYFTLQPGNYTII